jgi:hypothetical protein
MESVEQKSVEMQKPEMKYEDGKLKISASAGVDSDKDGQSSVKASLQIEVDAMEAIGEIVKNEVPQWLKDLLKSKEG